MTWQTIDTAPKDGTEIDVFCGGHGRVTDAWFQRGKWWEYTMGGFDQWGAFPLENQSPTHWMPVPEEPS